MANSADDTLTELRLMWHTGWANMLFSSRQHDVEIQKEPTDTNRQWLFDR
jgi:hypothetical protein